VRVATCSRRATGRSRGLARRRGISACAGPRSARRSRAEPPSARCSAVPNACRSSSSGTRRSGPRRGSRGPRSASRGRPATASRSPPRDARRSQYRRAPGAAVAAIGPTTNWRELPSAACEISAPGAAYRPTTGETPAVRQRLGHQHRPHRDAREQVTPGQHRQDRSRRAFVLLAAKEWCGLPRGDSQPGLPSWMKAVGTFTPVRSGAAAAIAQNGAGAAGQGGFIVIATLGVGAPVAIECLAGTARRRSSASCMTGWRGRTPRSWPSSA
jgi:hypothetical protein